MEIKLKDEWDIFETDSPDSLFTLEHIETKQQVTIHADYFPSTISLKSYVNKHYSKQGKLRSMILRQYPVKMHQFIHKYPNNDKDEQYQIQTYCVHQQFGYKIVGYTSYDDKDELAKFVDDVLKRITFMVGPTHRLIVHSVKKGESLSQIAKRYMPLRKTAVEDLMSFNKLRSSNLEIGQLIKIPIEKETKSKKAY